MTCYDCIHYDLCFDNGTLFLRYAKGIDMENAEIKCPFKMFKNKADFVEVVRCKDCKYFDSNDPNDKYCMFGNALSVSDDNSYCSYGKRRDT